MKPELHTAPNTRNALKFLVLKSYDGGKSWVRARLCHDFVAAAPEFPTVVATSVAYAIGAHAAVRLASYIRSLGYSARAHHVYSYRVLPVPIQSPVRQAVAQLAPSSCDRPCVSVGC